MGKKNRDDEMDSETQLLNILKDKEKKLRAQLKRANREESSLTREAKEAAEEPAQQDPNHNSPTHNSPNHNTSNPNSPNHNRTTHISPNHNTSNPNSPNQNGPNHNGHKEASGKNEVQLLRNEFAMVRKLLTLNYEDILISNEVLKKEVAGLQELIAKEKMDKDEMKKLIMCFMDGKGHTMSPKMMQDLVEKEKITITQDLVEHVFKNSHELNRKVNEKFDGLRVEFNKKLEDERHTYREDLASHLKTAATRHREEEARIQAVFQNYRAQVFNNMSYLHNYMHSKVEEFSRTLEAGDFAIQTDVEKEALNVEAKEFTPRAFFPAGNTSQEGMDRNNMDGLVPSLSTCSSDEYNDQADVDAMRRQFVGLKSTDAETEGAWGATPAAESIFGSPVPREQRSTFVGGSTGPAGLPVLPNLQWRPVGLDPRVAEPAQGLDPLVPEPVLGLNPRFPGPVIGLDPRVQDHVLGLDQRVQQQVPGLNPQNSGSPQGLHSRIYSSVNNQQQPFFPHPIIIRTHQPE